MSAAGGATLSVVIPVYNAAPYLESCVDSVLEQGLHDVQIIMVEDGSTDGSADVARSLVERCSGGEVTLLLQPENGGVSRARNRGLDAAERDYVTFLDADDLMAPHGLRRMLVQAGLTDADVVAGNIETFWDEGGERRYRRYWGLEHQSVFRYELTGPLECMPRLVYSVSACTKLYRRSFVEGQGLRFAPGIDFAEDQPFAIASYARAARISICPDVVYHYRIDNRGSAMRATFRLDRFERLRDVVGENLAELSGWPLYYYTRRALDYEILQNVRRIAVLPWGEAREAFTALRDALMQFEQSTCEEYVRGVGRSYRADYSALRRGDWKGAWLRHQHPVERLKRFVGR